MKGGVGSLGKCTFYMPLALEDRWKEFVKISKREGSSASEKLTEFIQAYVDAHAHGNPQTLLERFVMGGPNLSPDLGGFGSDMSCDLCNPWGMCLSLGSPCDPSTCPRRQPRYKEFLQRL